MRTFIAAGVIILFIFIQLWRGGEARRTIDGDGSGYYAYLTAVLIHQTTDFTVVYKVEKERRGLDYMAHYFHKTEKGMINKYYLGTALLMLPFFLLAWLYSVITGMPADGYNILFQYSVSLAAAVYLAVGLLALKRIFDLKGFSKPIQVAVLIVLLFGTNLFYYAFLHPSHSHVYSFAAIAVFLLFTSLFFRTGGNKYLMLSAMMLGVIVLIRPTNILILLSIPFIASDSEVFKQRIKQLLQSKVLLLFIILVFLSVFMLQPVFNLIQSGEITLWSYRNEGFIFQKPALLSFLFSYRKGFFVYTPLMLLIVPAMVTLWQRSLYQFITFIAYFLSLVFMLSSWWNWFFGDSYGMRAMIDHYPVLVLPIAELIRQLSGRKVTTAIISLFLGGVIILNLVQTYQYYAGILHPDSMSKEKYWFVFFKTSDEYRHVFGSYPEAVFGPVKEESSRTFLNEMEGQSAYWTSNGVVKSPMAYSGSYVAELNQSNIYSPTLVLTGESLVPKNEELYVSISLMYKELSVQASTEALLVYAASDLQNDLVFYKTFKMKQVPDAVTNQWRNAIFGFKVPAWDKEIRQVKVYIWNRQQGLFQIDDFDVNIYPVKR